LPVAYELKTLLPATIELVLLSSGLAFVIGLPLGVLSAAYKNRPIDHIARFLSVGTVSIPSFAIALFLQLVFYRWLGILPIGGRISREIQLFGVIPKITDLLLVDTLLTGNITLFKDALIHLVMPVVALAAGNIGFTARLTRSAMLEILSEDYIKAAKSYGLNQRVVLWSYALKNSLGPTATIMTMMLGYSLTNTFLVETIFSWPGIGNYVAISVITLNYPAILGVTIISAVSFVFLNMVADLVVALDPRGRK
jgi:peptide/nickel transport system permease protein